MIGSFTEVKPLFYWVQHILPLVYDDSLSYMELLGKVTKTLNELVENNNLLPDYIMKVIKEYISSGEIEKVLAEVLANYMLNVKFPPKGLTPAVGDGSADDTEAIQGCINYAYQNGGMAVYFPSGAYLTQPLTLNEKVTLFGQDRYTTRIVMKGGATKPLFTGTVDEMSLTGLGFDGNMDIQVNNVNLFTITVNSAIITNCLLTDGYDLLNITVNNELQLDNILFRHAVENALVVGGAGYVQADNLIFKSLSTLIGKNYIVLNTNKSILEEVKCFGAAPNGVLIGGNSNVVNMWCEACQTPYVDNGTNNTIHVYGASEDEKFTGDVTQYIGGFLNQTVAATKKLVARNVIDTAGGTRQESTTGNKTETVNGNDTETVGGDKKETVSGSKSVIVTLSLDENIGTNKISVIEGTNTETITGLSTENANGGKVLVSTDYNENVINKNVTAAKIEETLTGNKTVTAANIIETVSGDRTINGGDITHTGDNIAIYAKVDLEEQSDGNKNTVIKGNNTETVTGTSVETIASNKTINSPDIDLNSTNPIKYRNTIEGSFFDKLQFKDRNDNLVNALVDNNDNASLLRYRNSDRLNGKTIVMFGDSNGAGEGWTGSDGVFTVMREMYPSANWKNYSVGGAPFIETSDIALINQYNKMVSENVKPDYLILFSGNNDIIIQSENTGTNVIGYHTSYLPYWYDSSRLDRTTSVGSLAYLINLIKTNYPECKLSAVKRTNSHTHLDNIYKWAWDEFYYTFVKYDVPLMDFNTIFSADPIIPEVKAAYWADESHYNENGFRELVAPAIDSLLFNLEGNYVPFNALCVPYSTDNEQEAFEFLNQKLSDRYSYDGYIFFMVNNNTRSVRLTNFAPTAGVPQKYFFAAVNQANVFESKMYLSVASDIPVSLHRYYFKSAITSGDLGTITTSGIYSFLTKDIGNISQLPPDFPQSGGILLNFNLLINPDSNHSEVKVLFPIATQGIFYVGYQILTNTISWFKYQPNS